MCNISNNQRKVVSLHRFLRSYRTIKKHSPSYRLGQYFISCFIKDEHSDKLCTGLWNMDDLDAYERINLIIERYNWDVNKLILVREDRIEP